MPPGRGVKEKVLFVCKLMSAKILVLVSIVSNSPESELIREIKSFVLSKVFCGCRNHSV